MCDWKVSQLKISVSSFGISMISVSCVGSDLVKVQIVGKLLEFIILKIWVVVVCEILVLVGGMGMLVKDVVMMFLVCVIISYMLIIQLLSVKNVICFSDRMFVQFQIRFIVIVVSVRYRVLFKVLIMLVEIMFVLQFVDRMVMVMVNIVSIVRNIRIEG